MKLIRRRLRQMTKKDLENICCKMSCSISISKNKMIVELLKPLSNKKYKMNKTTEESKIMLFIEPKLKDNDKYLFKMVQDIWYLNLKQSSNEWLHLALLINTPGRVRKKIANFKMYYEYIYEFLSRCLKVIKKFPKDTMARMLAFKMIQEDLYVKYLDQIKTKTCWNISLQNNKYNFAILIPKNKMAKIIGKRGSNIKKFRKDNPNVNVYLNNKTKQMKLISHNLDSILYCAQQINNTIDNNGILIKTIINRNKWISGILFEISMKYREVSPVSGNKLWLTHLTGIGDLITHNGETYELKMNEYRAKKELYSGKYTGVGFLRDNQHTFFVDGKEKRLNVFLNQTEQKKIVSDAVHILETTKDGFKNKYVVENCYSDNFFRL